jgi:acetyl-CoA acetyltransferase
VTGIPAAIVGIGATEFSKNSGRSELRLAVESATAALADAGIDAARVDGMVTFSIDHNDEQAVARNLGVQALTFFARTPGGGGGACGCVDLATLAINGGKAEVVLCYRAMNERSQERFGTSRAAAGPAPAVVSSGRIDSSWTMPYGMVTPASWMAQSAQRYLYQYKATSESFGRVAVTQREYALSNPDAYFYGRPITLDDHQNSRMIADPLRLLDCCQESDGGVALVVTSLERARDLRQKPVRILGAAQGIGPDQHGMASVYRKNIAEAAETRVVADQLWRQTGLRPSDIDVASLYDHYSCAVLMQLEALGFCGLGEAPGLVEDGGIAIDGLIPTNTNGGQLSEAYIHGFNGIAELVRQLRGTAVNQVAGARLAVATSGSHVPTSGLVLGSID